LKTADFDYHLPVEFIAQTPLEQRDASRLLILKRDSGTLEHAIFRDLGGFLHPNDVLVLNQTRVIRARLFGRKVPTGGRVELLLLRRQEEQIWEVLVGGKGLVPGIKIQIEDGPEAEIMADLGGPRRLVKFAEQLSTQLDVIGHVPLPPYIHTHLDEPERYQTVYAMVGGSAAAPTAGLHFTPALIARLKEEGIRFATVTLHVGLDTFAPVNEDDPRQHEIHTEWCQITSVAVETIKAARQAGGRLIAVGTTSVRTLETAALLADPGEVLAPFEGPTDLFILPGHDFLVVDAMITNFHLPRSTLIMLVSAFAGRQRILETYETAKSLGYRFYSFGDVMLIL